MGKQSQHIEKFSNVAAGKEVMSGITREELVWMEAVGPQTSRQGVYAKVVKQKESSQKTELSLALYILTAPAREVGEQWLPSVPLVSVIWVFHAHQGLPFCAFSV